MKFQRIRKNKHFVYWLDRRIRFFLFPNRKSFKIKFAFTESCKYDLKDSDQFDWNKLWGIDFESLFSTRTNTAMVGWRYNPKSDLFELNPYIHRDKETFFNSKPILKVKVDEIIEVSIIVSENSWTYIFKDDNSKYSRFVYRLNNPKKFKWATEINSYFGGNRKAPNEIKIFKTRTSVTKLNS